MSDKLDNFFDDLTTGVDPVEALRQSKEAEVRSQRLDYLIHSVFKKNEDGAELLAIWEQSLIMAATANPGDDMVGIGIAEGYKRFIRGIILTIKRAENE